MASETKFKETEIGMIPEDWNIFKFGDLFGVPLRNGLTRPKKVRGSGIKMVNMGELFSYGRIFSEIEMDRVPVSNEEYEKFMLKKGDLLFARQSLVLEGAGKCSIIMDDLIPATFESHLIRVRLNEKLVDPLFYYYFFKSNIGKNIISSIVEQVAAAGIRGSDLGNLSVLYPSKEEQKNIANIFSILDDKIGLNRQMNSTLEQIAQSLFKRWFIDFEFPNEEGNPYKSSGGRMVDSELGEIPDGWRVKAFSEVIDVNPSRRLSKGKTAIKVSMGDLNTWQSWIDSWQKEEYKSGPKFKNGDTLFARITPSLENGKTAFVNFLSEGETAFGSTEFIVFGPKVIASETYIYCLSRSEYIREIAINAMTGTSGRQRVPNDCFDQLLICVPPDKIAGEFDRIVVELFEMIENNSKESIRLKETRDSLLPKLMSGKIRVQV